MAKSYSSTITINVWKQHSCVGCGSDFRYRFTRALTGQGATPKAAEKAAQKIVLKSMERDVDQQPCPACGLYQPDMVADKKSGWHWLVLCLCLPVIALFAILTWTDVFNYSFGSWCVAGIGVAGLVCHLLVDFMNPNRSLEANREVAARRVESGDVVLMDEKPAEPEGLLRGSSSSLATACVYLLAAAAALAPAGAEGMRLANGWPNNPLWRPPVAGPGDQPYVYFEKVSFTSVKGYWNAKGTATVLNNGEVGLQNPVLQVVSKNDTWGGTINIGGKESKTGTHTPWARVAIPQKAELEGKLLKLQINLTISYPELQGDHYENRNLRTHG
jgi:hypothetical protein